jgi:ketosteroid isomerase-like protein
LTASGVLLMTRLTVTLALLLAFFPSGAAMAQSAADEDAIRARLASYAEARNKQDAHAEALCYTTDGDFRSSAGPFVSGREAVEKQLTVTIPDYRFLLKVTHLRFVTPDVAIVDADVNTGVGNNLAPLLGVYVMAKQGSTWLISGGRISRAPTPPAAAPAR